MIYSERDLTIEDVREKLCSGICTNSELLTQAAKIIGRSPGGFVYTRLLRLAKLMEELDL